MRRAGWRGRLAAAVLPLAWLVASAASGACANGGDADLSDDAAKGDGGAKSDGGALPGTDGGKGPTPLPDGGTTPPPTAGTVVINEIMAEAASGSNATDVEFVELHNPGSSSVSLDGWTLRYRSASNSTAEIRATFGAGDTIAAGDFLVVGTAGYSPKDVTMAAGLKLGGGQVGLLDDSQAIVDRVGWGATTSGEYTAGDPAPMAQAGQSIARTGNAGKNDLDFVVAPTPTPGAAN